MTKLQWDMPTSHLYEAGLDRGVLYLADQDGVSWTGLISVEERPSGESTPYYMDGEKYLNRASAGEFEATITAFTYPDEFDQCNGSYEIRPGLNASRQRRRPFGMAFRTKVGNEFSDSLGYKIHLIYNALATPSQRMNSTLSDGAQALELSWDITTTPPPVSGMRRTAHIVIDSQATNPLKLQNLEDILYGSDSSQARLPSIDEIIALYDDPLEFMLTDHGDGSYTILAPNSNLSVLSNGQFIFDWPTAVDNLDDTFTITG